MGFTSVMGGRNPALLTGVGKRFRAASCPTEADHRLVRRVPHENNAADTLTTSEALWQELTATRQRGFGIDSQENVVGVDCVAIPT